MSKMWFHIVSLGLLGQVLLCSVSIFPLSESTRGNHFSMCIFPWCNGRCCSLLKNLRKLVLHTQRECTHLLLPWGLGIPLAQGEGCGYSRKDSNKLPSFCKYNLRCKLEDYQSCEILLQREGKKEETINIINSAVDSVEIALQIIQHVLKPSLNHHYSRLTCEHISHDGITQKWDIVDDVPETFEVGEQVVDGVGRGLQRQFDPGEELSCKITRGKFSKSSKFTEQVAIAKVDKWFSFVACCVHTYALCSFVHKTLFVCSHIHNCLLPSLCKHPCSGMDLSNMGYLWQIMLSGWIRIHIRYWLQGIS